MKKEDILSLFAAKFHSDAAAVYTSPGRINLIGEHTDYNGGFVFPGAVVQGIMAAIRPNGTDAVNLFAADVDDAVTFSLTDPQGPEPRHFRYVYGVMRELMDSGVGVKGFDAVYAGDVPLGAGMSSSAALSCCFAYALADMFDDVERFSRMALAKVGQATEHKYIGVNCGIMDQFASMHGREGALMRLDCRSGEYKYYPWHPKGYRLMLINSCVKHELVGSPYNDRRRSCEHVAALVGVETLRDCTWDQLEQVRSLAGEEDYRRARYVLGEADRVQAVCDALERDDYEAVGHQMYLTHEGLSKDYEVSCEELDFLVDEAKRFGVTGARIMGGGFGGCSINLVKENLYDDFAKHICCAYREKFGVECKVIPVEIGAGARRL